VVDVLTVAQRDMCARWRQGDFIVAYISKGGELPGPDSLLPNPWRVQYNCIKTVEIRYRNKNAKNKSGFPFG
jgi:hypothetical protein